MECYYLLCHVEIVNIFGPLYGVDDFNFQRTHRRAHTHTHSHIGREVYLKRLTGVPRYRYRNIDNDYNVPPIPQRWCWWQLAITQHHQVHTLLLDCIHHEHWTFLCFHSIWSATTWISNGSMDSVDIGKEFWRECRRRTMIMMWCLCITVSDTIANLLIQWEHRNQTQTNSFNFPFVFSYQKWKWPTIIGRAVFALALLCGLMEMMSMTTPVECYSQTFVRIVSSHFKHQKRKWYDDWRVLNFPFSSSKWRFTQWLDNDQFNWKTLSIA